MESKSKNGITNGKETQEEIFYDVSENFLRNGSKSEDTKCDAVAAETSFIVKEVTALASVPKHATHYKMDHKQRGIAYIFNHEIFDDNRLRPRYGTNEDCKNLKECLGGLGFDVQIFQDLKCQEMEYIIDESSRIDYSHQDCILIVVLSYGEKGKVYSRDFLYKPDYLWTSFTANNCPSLAGKPKLFFLHTCEVDNTEMVITSRMSETDGDIVDTYRIPVQADFLIVNSTAKGPWFIHSLCKELKERAHYQDLLTILTIVTQTVALALQHYEPNSKAAHEHIPCMLSMLTRLIQFKFL